MAQIKTKIKTKIKSIVLSVFHSIVIPLGLAFMFSNIIWALAWWMFAFAMYEYTEAGQQKAGRMPFLVITNILLFLLVVFLILAAKGA